MARVDYYAIEQSIADQISSHNPGVLVNVEQNLQLGTDPQVFIYLEKRSVPANLQGLSAGKRTRFRITFSIWVYAYALTIADGMRLRDDLLGNVELALNADHLFGRSDVNMSYMDGGRFESAMNAMGFNVGAEIVLQVDATSVAS